MTEARITDRKVCLLEPTLYKTDINSKKIRFTTERYYGEEDLSETDTFIKFIRIDGQADKIKLTQIVGEEEISFIWTIGLIETCFEGILQAQISFESASHNFIMNTEIFTIEIKNSITGYEQINENAIDTSTTAKFVKKAEIKACLKPTVLFYYAEENTNVTLLPDTIVDIAGSFGEGETLSVNYNKSDWQIGDMAELFFTLDGGSFEFDEDVSSDIVENGIGINELEDGQRYEMIFYCIGDKTSITILKP